MRENNANRFLLRMANLLNLFIMVEFKSYYTHFSCYESLSKGYNVQVSLCFTVTSNSMSPNGRRQGLEGAAPFRAVINSVFGRLCRKTAPWGREDTRVWYRETMFSCKWFHTIFPCTDPCTNTFWTSVADECQMNPDVTKWTSMSERRDNFAMLEDWLFL